MMREEVKVAYITVSSLIIIKILTLAFQWLTHMKIKTLEREYTRGLKDRKE
jgi:hypothetical protein